MSANKKQRAQYKKRRLRKLKKKMPRPSSLPPETMILDNPPGMVKMSKVLEDFVKPYMESSPTEESLRKLLAVGIVAWNAALLPPTEREELLRETEETLPAELRNDFRVVLEPMIERKLAYFADNRRGILNFELSMGRGNPFLNVMSTLEV
jgi:hypothetical protein